jgi:hypothetical protein
MLFYNNFRIVGAGSQRRPQSPFSTYHSGVCQRIGGFIKYISIITGLNGISKHFQTVAAQSWVHQNFFGYHNTAGNRAYGIGDLMMDWKNEFAV